MRELPDYDFGGGPFNDGTGATDGGSGGPSGGQYTTQNPPEYIGGLINPTGKPEPVIYGGPHFIGPPVVDPQYRPQAPPQPIPSDYTPLHTWNPPSTVQRAAAAPGVGLPATIFGYPTMTVLIVAVGAYFLLGSKK